MILQKFNNLMGHLSGKRKRSTAEVFYVQESTMQFWKKSYTVTKIITETWEEVPNTKGFAKCGGAAPAPTEVQETKES